MPILSVKNLSKKYGEMLAVDSISFHVKEGSLFAFLGPNGAGKTTTIKMLTTLLEPTSGKICINGFDPQTQKEAVRRSFGIVFQDQSLDDELTAYENMKFHAVLYGVKDLRRIDSLLSLVDLTTRAHDYVKHYSGGMKRRLEIARGLLHTPRILFLDEPTVGLDPQTRNSIWEYLLSMVKNERMTIFFTTHYLEEASKVADTIAIIDHGKLIAQGSVRQLQEKTKTKTLEDAYLKLTGATMRPEHASAQDSLRAMSKVWRR